MLGQLIVGLTIGSVYGLVAIGFSMIFRSVGILSFAHQQFVMLGAMIGFTLMKGLGIPLFAAVIVAAIITGLIGIVAEWIGLSPIRHRGAPNVNQIIATIGWGIVFANLAMVVWGPYPLAYPHTSLSRSFMLAGVPVSLQNVVILISCLLFMGALQAFLKFTRIGHAMRAVADDEATARLMGINPEITIRYAFCISEAMAGVAGVFIGTLFYASFDLGAFSIRGFPAAVLGGFGHLGGAIVGGLLLGIIETLGATYVASAYRDVIAFGIVILILLIRPKGLMGKWRRTI